MLKNLVKIQNELKVGKTRYNSFGKYNYRSLDDICQAVKPLLKKYDCQMTISDDVIEVGNRIYFKATVTITDSDGNRESVSAFAREEETKKGMDSSQISGTASSYARKYALNALFLIDDTKDADTDEYRYQQEEPAQPKAPVFDKKFMQDHGAEKITARERERLRAACSASGKSLEMALQACRRSSIEDISFVQYLALMSQMGAAA